MKKIYILSGLMCLLPGLSFGENPRIAELTRSKQEKMERLQKCEGTTKALKIAGLSTIGLTAVGVVGNVVESQKVKEYQGQSNALDTQIAQTKKEIEKAETEKNKTATAAEPTEPTKPTATPTTSTASTTTTTSTTASTTTGLAAVMIKEIDGKSRLKRDFNSTRCDDGMVSSKVGPCDDLHAEGQWKVEFDYGTVKGVASCNSNSGTYAVTTKVANELTATAGNGDGDQYCWCRVTKFKSRDGTESDVTSSSWVFLYDYDSGYQCTNNCVHYCVAAVDSDSDFRGAMFAGAQ